MLARRRDQSELNVEIYVKHVKGPNSQGSKFCVFLRDLAVELAYENELKRRELFTHKIIEASQDALLVVNTSGQIVRVNQAAVVAFRASKDELCETQINRLLGCSDTGWILKEIQRYARGSYSPNAIRREVEGVRANNITFPMEFFVTGLDG